MGKKILGILISLFFIISTCLGVTITVIEKDISYSFTKTPGNKVSIEAKSADVQGFQVTSGGVVLDEKNSFITPENDVVIEALYSEPTEFLLTVFNFNNITRELKTAGEEVTVTLVEDENYEFVSWEATGITLTPEQQVSKSITFSMPNNIVKLTTNYKEKYQINYYANGEIISAESQIKIQGEPLILSSLVPVKLAYDFLGWSTDIRATEATYQPGDSFNLDKNTTLYAVFKQKSLPTLAASSNWYSPEGIEILKSKITRIDIKSTYEPGEIEAIWDASDGKAKTINVYVEDDGSGNDTYKLTIAGNGREKIKANADSSKLFENFTNVTQITGLGILDTSEVTNMSYMFNECNNLGTIDVSGFNTSKVTNMHGMFRSCDNLTSVVVDNFNTSKVTDMCSMFFECTNIRELNVRNFDTSNVTNMRSMFNACSSLTTIDVSGFNTSKVETMYAMFCMCSGLTSLEVDNFNTSAVTDMGFMFNGCSSLTTIDVSGFDTKLAENMATMFNECTSLITLDVSTFDTTNVGEPSKTLNEITGEYVYFGLAKFATNCPALTTIILGENFAQEGNIPEPGSEYGMFYVGTSTSTTVTGTNEVMFKYDWAADNRALTAPTLAAGSSWYEDTIVDKSKITRIDIKSTYETEEEATWDASAGKVGTIRVYVEDDGLEGDTYKLTIVGNGSGKIMANADSSDLFKDFTNVTAITGFKDSEGNVVFDTSKTTNMHLMFYECNNLASVDISGFNTSRVTNMGGMFYNCSSLESLDVSGLDTVAVTNMGYMFYKCSGLTALEVSGFETGAVTSMTYMFYGCSGLTGLDLSEFDTQAVNNMSYMFYDCRGLTSLDVSGFDTSKVTNMYAMFNTCIALTELNVSGFDTRNVTNMRLMFNTCKSLQELDVSNFITDNVTTMYGMFNECQMLTELDVTGFNTSKVTDMNNMFSGCDRLTSIDVSNFDTSKVTTMALMFRRCSSLTSLDVSNFDTNSIESSGRTEANIWIGLVGFAYNCPNLTTITLGEDFGQSKNLPAAGSETGMFYVGTEKATVVLGANSVMTNYAWGTDHRALAGTILAAGSSWYEDTIVEKSKITRIDIKATYETEDAEATWDASAGKVKTVIVYVEDDGLGNNTYKLTIAGNGSGKIMANADSSNAFLDFSNVKQITGLDILDTSGVTNMTNMFRRCGKLETLNLSSFDTSLVTTMGYMFDECSSLTSLNLSGFNTENVTNMNGLFHSCSGLITLNINGWNTSKVTQMNSMFLGCSSLTNLNVTGFDVDLVTNMGYMFQGCSSLTSLDLSEFVTTSATSMVQMFKKCSSLTELNLSKFETSNVLNMGGMFSDCTELEEIIIDVDKFDTSLVTNMGYMFAECNSLVSIDLSKFNTSNVTSMKRMFNNCNSLVSINLSSFNTEKVENMANMFSNCTSLTSLNISNFNTTGILSSEKTYDETTGTYEYNGLLRFARNCPALTTIILGENFGQSTNVSGAGSDLGMFYLGTSTSTTVTGTNEVMFAYDWAADHRVLTPPTLAAGSTWYSPEGTEILKSEITSIEIKNTYEPGEIEATWDASAGKVGTIRVYVEDDGLGGDTYKLTIVGNGSGKIMANADSSDLFKNFTNVTQITGLDILDTSEVTTMFAMFNGCSNLSSLDLRSFDTSNVTSMRAFVYQCSSLTEIKWNENINTEKVTNMANMFFECSSLGSIDLSGFNTVNVTNMSNMFYKCSNLSSLDISGFDTENVTTMASMFYECVNLSSLEFDKDKFDTSKVTDMYSMFAYCSNLTELDLSGFNTSNVTRMSLMFGKCSSLTDLDISNFNTENVITMESMFYECSSLTELDVSSFNTSNVTNMISMFNGCDSLTKLELNVSEFDTGNVTTMASMFNGCSSLTELNVSGFDTTNVVNMSYMFSVCEKLTELDVSGFETQSVKYMSHMFSECKGLTSLDVSGFDTSEVTDMSLMFYHCKELTTLAVDNFDTGKVENMRSMFVNCQKLTQLNVSNFETANVTAMNGMFWGCSNLAEIDVSGFNTEKVTNMGRMFADCINLTTLDLSNFDTSAIESSGRIEQVDYIQYTGLGRFAHNCPSLTTIILGEDFVQSANLPAAGSDAGMFYVGTEKAITVAGANSVMQGYAWGTDHRALTAPTLAAGSSWYEDTIVDKSKITRIDIKSTYETEEEATWDASAGKVGTIRVYVEDDGLGGDTYKLTIVGNGREKIKANADSSSLFSGFSNLKQINGLDMLDTSEVTNMRAMFNGCSSLTAIDVSSLDTSKVETMHAMFYMCGGLTSINFGEDKFDTSNVLEMGTMFRECSNLVSLDLRRFDTSQVEDMSYMFYKCINLASITFDKVKFNTSNVTNMRSMFGECSGLATIDISEFTTSAATNTSYMFYKCSNLANITFNKDKFTTSAVTDMSYMFYECRSLTNLDISGFNTVNVTNMLGMFYDCSNLVNLTFDKVKFNTSNVTNMRSMFNKCSSLATLDVSGFNTSKVTDMSNMFNECSGLAELDVSGFNTSKVTNMSNMFNNCNGLAELDVSGFNTSKVTNMSNMFNKCSGLTELDVSKFGTSLVTSMRFMFAECVKVTELDVSGFDTSAVTDMGYMFAECVKVTELDVSGFDTSKVTNMAAMFRSCKKMTILDVSSFDTRNVSPAGSHVSGTGATVYEGLARFAGNCTILTTIILGENFGQANNIPEEGSEYGMFYANVATNIPTTVVGANSAMTNYVWGSDNRTYNTATTYEVIYDVNGGNETIPKQYKIAGAELKLRSTKPTKEGFYFAGWGTTSTATTVEYLPSTSYTADAQITLYAIWGETIPLSEIPIGAYIAYNPVYEENGEEVNEVVVLGTDAGKLDTDNETGIDQTFSFSDYTGGWKVLYKDEVNNQITLIAAESVGNLTLGTTGSGTTETDAALNGGKIGYAKAIYTLNKMCDDYAKGEYAVSGRAPGYSDVKPGPDNLLDEMDINDISHAKIRELVEDTENPLASPYYPYRDEYNDTETNYIRDTQVDGNYVLRQSSEYVWLASRNVSTNTNSSFGMYRLMNTGSVSGIGLYYGRGSGSAAADAYSYGVRPVIILKSGIKIVKGVQDGKTVETAYVLSY